MKTLLKVIKWLAAALFGFILVVGLCWWLLPDEKPDPEATRFVDHAAVPPTAKNAYFMIWGFAASPELDAHVVGQKIVAAHDRILAAEKYLTAANFKLDSFYGDHPLTFPKDSKRICEFEKQNCLTVYQEKQAEVEAQSETYKAFLARYRQIREYEDFGFALSQVSAQTPIPAWNPIIRISDLVDGSIAARMKSKHSQQGALEELAAEIASWRRMLQGNDWLITQMISVVTLGRKYWLASEIMSAHPEVVAAYPALMAKITAPLSPQEANVVSSVGAESRLTVGTLRGTETAGRIIEDTFFVGLPGPPLRAAMAAGSFRVNATVNEAYRYFNELIQFMAKSPKEVLEGHLALREKQEKSLRLSPRDIFYNPVGRILNAGHTPSFFEYAFRVDDLIGYTRLLDLQRRVIEAGAAPDRVASLVAAAGPGLMDPYTEKPMQWNPATKRLSFTGHGKRKAEFSYVKIAHFK